MAALPDDPTIDGPPEVSPDQMDMGLDPGQPPADPYIRQEPDIDPYEGVGEFELREQVEACCLAAVETCAKAVEVGVGASNPQFAQAYGQAAASLAQAYAALAQAEAKEQAAQEPVSGPERPSGVDGRVGP